MKGKSALAYSRLGSILAQQHRTVAGFIEKLNTKGIFLDKKTVYRLAGPKPIQTINTRVLGVVCDELNVGVGDLITWQQPQPGLQRIDEKTQQRLSELMGRNNEGVLTAAEAKELAELGAYAEKLSLENARLLAEIAGAKKRERTPRGEKRTAARRKAKVSPASRKRVAA